MRKTYHTLGLRLGEHSTVNHTYANELGSPFITFEQQIDPACASGKSLYLYDLETPANQQYQNAKMPKCRLLPLH